MTYRPGDMLRVTLAVSHSSFCVTHSLPFTATALSVRPLVTRCLDSAVFVLWIYVIVILKIFI